MVEPGIERTFTQRLQNLIQNQTNLSLTPTNGDLLYEGEITQFRVTPMTATANQLAAQNRLTITVNVRFVNKKKEQDNFEKPFSYKYHSSINPLSPNDRIDNKLMPIFNIDSVKSFEDSIKKEKTKKFRKVRFLF